ncbi:hypothetical protein KCU93_g183, partial [Aureobasidium melanogenum]
MTMFISFLIVEAVSEECLRFCRRKHSGIASEARPTSHVGRFVMEFRSGANGVQLFQDPRSQARKRHPAWFWSGNASWAGVCLLNVLYQRQCLQRLSKTHLITQDGRHCVLVHVRQERQASCLLSGAYGTRKQW